jgi:hypothetical protein
LPFGLDFVAARSIRLSIVAIALWGVAVATCKTVWGADLEAAMSLADLDLLQVSEPLLVWDG